MALGHVKLAFEAMEVIAKSSKLNIPNSAPRAMAVEYFLQIYRLQLVLMKVAYGQEFDDYFEEWTYPLEDPHRLIQFDTLERHISSDMPEVSLANCLPPPDKVSRRYHPFGDTTSPHAPVVVRNNRGYGPDYIWPEKPKKSV